jgi:hypothetical protein
LRNKIKEKKYMNFSRSKTITAAFALLLALSIVASLTLSPETLGVPVQPPAGSTVPSYAQLNVAPNPAGVGQTVTVNMYLLVPLLTSESAVNMTVVQKDPDGVTKTLGPFTSDATGGTYTTMVPDKTGEWTFQFFYGGQTMVNDVIELPSQSDVVTLVVQEEPIPRSAYPITPLPTEWWQTPITAENVQEWYKIAGPWLGYGTVTFANTGGYNLTGNYNPQTESVLAGHVLWTKIWAGGGVSGVSGNEESGHYWSTSQYWPKYAPVIINGIMYSTWYTATTGYTNGIMATDLYTGETLWTIDTTNPLLCGMVTQWKTINAYGCIGPYIWTSGPLTGVEADPGKHQYNMYDGITGKYVLSVVNGPIITPWTYISFTTDENGNMLGYYINSTTGTLNTYGPAPSFGPQPLTGQVNVSSSAPVLVCFNMSQALGNSWGWAPAAGTVIDFRLGVMWAKPLPTVTDKGVPIDYAATGSSVAINGITDDAVVMENLGFNAGRDNQQTGWALVVSMDANTGAQLWAKNFTTADISALVPYTNLASGGLFTVWGAGQTTDGLFILANQGANWDVEAINARTGTTAWESTLEGDNGADPNIFSSFNIQTLNGPGVTIFEGFGGDIWCYNNTNGNMLWYTNTTKLIGDPGIETPYGTWPLWVFSCTCQTNDVAYLPVGHEYNPPLFHGAQLLAINITDGTLIWSELGTYVESTSISYGVLLSRNAYDNQIYAFGKGPSSVTVTAPDVGVTTETPVTIRGTVMDVSPGTRALVQPDVTRTKQNEVALRFPNGVPCVSDESQSKWMEYVYQQQPLPTNATRVEVVLDVIDANGNYYNIGTATSDTSGMFTFTWTPIIPGEFTVVATFDGTNSYYGSCAETSFYASEAPAPTPEPTPMPASTADLYFVPMSVGIIIAIIVVGALLAILLLRKR